MIDGMQQAWLSHVTKAVYKRERDSDLSIFKRQEPGPITAARYGLDMIECFKRNIKIFLHYKTINGCLCVSLFPPQMPLQKLLFSATLTQNPEKLQQLGLHQPRLFSSTQGNETTQEKFIFPQGLTVSITVLTQTYSYSIMLKTRRTRRTC